MSIRRLAYLNESPGVLDYLVSDADPATLTPQLSPQIAATLQQHIPILLSAVSRKINIAQVAAALGNFTDIEVDKIVLGATQIGQVTLNGTSADLRSATVNSGSDY